MDEMELDAYITRMIDRERIHPPGMNQNASTGGQHRKPGNGNEIMNGNAQNENDRNKTEQNASTGTGSRERMNNNGKQ